MKRLFVACLLAFLAAGIAVAQEPQRWEYGQLGYNLSLPQSAYWNSPGASFTVTGLDAFQERLLETYPGPEPTGMRFLVGAQNVLGYHGWELVAVREDSGSGFLLHYFRRPVRPVTDAPAE